MLDIDHLRLGVCTEEEKGRTFQVMCLFLLCGLLMETRFDDISRDDQNMSELRKPLQYNV